MQLAVAAALVLAVAPGDKERSRELAQRSAREYDLGQFQDALRDLQQAYLLDPVPGLLFNLGQTHRALEHFRDAELMFRNYLRYRPNAANRGQVERLIDEMEQKEAEGGGAPEPEESAPALRTALRRAHAHMQALEFELALPLLQKAARARALSSAERARAEADLGLCQVNLGHDAEARAAFQRAFELDPSAQLPRGVSPKIRGLFEQARLAADHPVVEPAPAAPEPPAPIVVREPEPAPAAAVSGPPAAEVETHAQRYGHGLAIGLGVGALVAAGVSFWGWSQVWSFQLLAGQSKRAPGTVPASAALASQRAAQTGETVAIVLDAVAAGLAGGAAFTW